jgi:hypothetical protein
MNSTVDTKEREFALAIRRALDESTEDLPQPTLARLALARRAALQRKKPEVAPQTAPVTAMAPAFAGAMGAAMGARPPVVRAPRFVLMWPMFALVAALIGVAYWEDQQRIADTADIDAAMLSDELPLNAYLDHGFNAYLSRTR